MAVRAVKGVPEEVLDKIQKEMIGYNNMISPPYFPKVITQRQMENGFLLLGQGQDNSALINLRNMLYVKRARSTVIIFVI